MIVEVQDHIGGDHAGVQYIEEQNIPHIMAAEDLAGNAAEIPDVDEHQKGKTFAFSGFVPQGGFDVVGPGQAEGHHHADFQKLCHKKCLLFTSSIIAPPIAIARAEKIGKNN